MIPDFHSHGAISSVERNFGQPRSRQVRDHPVRSYFADFEIGINSPPLPPNSKPAKKTAPNRYICDLANQSLSVSPLPCRELNPDTRTPPIQLECRRQA